MCNAGSNCVHVHTTDPPNERAHVQNPYLELFRRTAGWLQKLRQISLLRRLTQTDKNIQIVTKLLTCEHNVFGWKQIPDFLLSEMRWAWTDVLKSSRWKVTCCIKASNENSMICFSTGTVVLYDATQVILPANRIDNCHQRTPFNKYLHHFFFMSTAR